MRWLVTNLEGKSGKNCLCHMYSLDDSIILTFNDNKYSRMMSGWLFMIIEWSRLSEKDINSGTIM